MPKTGAMPGGSAKARTCVFITGASRGLGLELARQCAGRGFHVIASCRDPRRADDLREIAGSVELHQLDVADPAAPDALAARLDGRAIDILINNAGIRGDMGGLGSLDAADFQQVISINTLAPLLLTRAFLPNIRLGRRKTIANISSSSGSIAHSLHDDEGDYAYRCSKSALNMATAMLARDLRGEGIIVLALHPGWAKTDMGGPDATVPVCDSASGLLEIIAEASLADSGSFRRYNAAAMSW